MAREPIVDFGFRDGNAAPGPAMTQPPAPAVPPVSDAFRARAQRWQRELLDVSRRNRAINYRESRASLSLPAAPEDLWSTLVVAEGATSFNARNFAPASPDPGQDPAAIDAFGRASRLAERARLADREQGIQVLFAALGWLDWKDSDGQAMRSPLVLVPVDIAYDRQRGQVDLQAAADDPPEVNPSLSYLLQSQYGIRLPRLEDAEGEPLHATLAAFLGAVGEVVAQQSGWVATIDGPAVDVFSFAKLAMVDEIEHSLGRLAQHPILRALTGEQSLPGVEAPEQPLDARCPPGKLRVVVAADAYQLEAVALAASGVSFVIEGPPGTGKSQTITNIAAELMAQGKRVLFVAEKRVAREVVLDNLRQAGLGEACLHLASNAGATSRADAKAQVIKDIIATLDAGTAPPPPEPALPARTAELRERLNAYAAGISRPLGDGGWTTAFEVFGKAAATAAERIEGVDVPAIDRRTRYWLDDVLEAARSLDGFEAVELEPLAGSWAYLRWTSVDQAAAARLTAALDCLEAFDQRLASIAGPALSPAAAASDVTLERAATLAVGLEDVARFRRASNSFFRFVNPAFYSARSARARYLEAGFTETGDEGARAAELRSLLGLVGDAGVTAAEAFGDAYPARESAGEIAAWARGLQPGLARLPALARAAAFLAEAESMGMRDALTTLLSDTANHGRLATVVPAAVYGAWAEALAQGVLALDPAQHARLVESYGRLEDEMLGWARSAVLREVRSRRPRSLNHAALAPLVKYAHAKRRPALRTMLGNSREAVQLLKPLLLMSPLAAAQYLCHGDGKTYGFDAVIVDEASMIPTPDMVVALGLAPQAIIVGDSKQMPPTNFFTREISPVADDQAQEDDVTFESILDEAAPLLPSTMLRAHYRSRDESLIAFSNVHFYDGKLVAFPDAWGSRPQSGVRFELVPDAVYGRGASRANPAEAARTIELLRAELQASEGHRQVAITAMSLAQQAEILGQLEDAAALDPAIRGWLEGGGQVRNLETVQGDESDVMLLSVGYGRDSEGRMILNFGPLGQDKGERRLNVAITRAKWKTVVVTSIRAGEIDTARTSSVGALRLRDYLDYAERGPESLPSAAVQAAPLSAFEDVLMERLRAAGLQCVPRVGVGGYRVDIAVRHPEDPERFVLGIECDGPLFSGAPSARDRELGRRAVLERMGWTMHRAFAPAWLRDEEAELARLLERYRAAILA